MANIITPSVSNLIYAVIDIVNKKVYTTIQKVQPGTELIDNSDGLLSIDGIVRGNATAMAAYIIAQMIDSNTYTIPDWLPSSDGQTDYTGLSSNQLDSLLQLYLDYFNENLPVSDYTINLQGSIAEPNQPLNFGTSNTLLIALQDLFTGHGYIFTAIIN